MAAHVKVRHRKPRNSSSNPEEADPNPNRSKPSTISSILLSNDTTTTPTKKKNFTSATFRGLGCTASSQVSVPAVIRTSANWEPKKKKNRLINNNNNNNKTKKNNNSAADVNNGNPSSSSLSLALSSSCVGAAPTDVWCGLTTDAASVDCVVSTRPVRGRSSYTARRMVTPEDIPFLESDAALVMPRFRADIPASRHHRHVRHGFGEGLAEIVMLQSNLLMGGRLDSLDRYRSLRLDTDNMSYEELLELGDRIGYVSTGLREDDITRCLRKSKITLLNDLSSLFATEMERKCTICQEEYEQDDETGKLNCGHFYHIECIKQWLEHKNICPICKKAAVSQT